MLEALLSQVSGDTVKTMSKRISVDDAHTESAVQNAIPILLNALQKNSASSSGLASLQKALDRDHDGSLLDNLTGYLQQPEQANGAGILGHILGNNKGRVEQYVSKSSGISLGNAGGLMEMLAPIVMGYLGKQNRGSDSNIGEILQAGLQRDQRDKREVQREDSLFKKLLDQDGDGSITDDLFDIGTSIFGSIIKKR
jgi:hypothetical protein